MDASEFSGEQNPGCKQAQVPSRYLLVLSWDAQIRQRLRGARAAAGPAPRGHGQPRAAGAAQHVRGRGGARGPVRAVTHRRHGGLSRHPRRAPVVGGAAVAQPQRGCDSSLVASAAAAAAGWLVDLYHDDFGTAIIYDALAFRRRDFEDGGSDPADEFSPPRLACAAIEQAMFFLRDRACRSLSHFNEFLGLSHHLHVHAGAAERRGSWGAHAAPSSPKHGGYILRLHGQIQTGAITQGRLA